jgi:uncharacterized protein (TIGR00297 family)
MGSLITSEFWRDAATVALFSFFLILLIGVAEGLRKKYPAYQEATRKLVHMVTGLLIALTPFAIQCKWPLVGLALFFVLFNWLAIRHGWLNGLHNTARPTLGTVFYPLSFLILLLWLWDDYRSALVIAMLIMAISDATAALVGRSVARPRIYYLGPEGKSLQGSLAMFGSSFVIVVICLFLNPSPHPATLSILWIAAMTAIMATACEAISFTGSDNLTVPLGAAFVLHYMLTHTPADAVLFSLGMSLSLILAVVSGKIGFLKPSGSAAVFLLGTLVFGIGRWTFGWPILTFFILSSLLSKVGKKKKQRYSDRIEKSGSRDVLQVLANGGLAGVLLMIWYFYPLNIFYILYVGSLAAVTADTWATELGMLSRSTPRSILNFKQVPAGASGGITVIGTVGAALGSLVLAGVGMLSGLPMVISGRVFWIILLAGFLASMVDSILGASLQASYRCPHCGRVTEKEIHCTNQTTHLIGGWAWMNNDMVNILAALAGMLMVYASLTIFT